MASKSDNNTNALTEIVNYSDPKTHSTPLISAVFYGHLEVVKALLNQGCVDVNASGDKNLNLSPLQFAILARRSEIADALVADPRIDLFHVDHDGSDLEMTAKEYNCGPAIISKIKPKMIESAGEELKKLPAHLEKLKERLSSREISQLIESINHVTRCLRLDKFKKQRDEVRQGIVSSLTARVNSFIGDEDVSFDKLYDELLLLTLIRREIHIIQGLGGTKIQFKRKGAMINIISLMEKVSGKLIKKIDEGKVTSITHAILFLAKGDFNNPQLLSKYMLDYFMADDDLSISYAKAAMSCLGEAQRKLVKKNLLDYVKDVASIHQNDLNETTNWIKVLAQQCGEGDKKVALFEVFRSGSPEKLDHNTNTRTWKKFLEVMKTGNFLTDESLNESKKSSQPSFGLFGRQSDGASTQTELQTLSKPTDGGDAKAKPNPKSEILKK